MAADDAAVVVTLRANLKDYEAALKSAVRTTERAAKAAEQAVSGIGKGTTFKVIQGGAQQASKSINALNADAKNLGFQISDIGTQLASGTSPLLIMAQQGGQVVQSFSGITSASAALKLALSAIVSPIGLITIATTAATLAWSYFFSETDKGSEKAQKALKEHRDLIRDVAKAYGDALPALKAFNDYLEAQEENTKIVSGLEAAVKDAGDALKKALDTAGTEGIDKVLGIFKNFENLKIREVTAQWEEFKQHVADGTVTIEEAERMGVLLNTTLSALPVRSGDTLAIGFMKSLAPIQELIQHIKDLNGELKTSTDTVQDLFNKMVQLPSIGAPIVAGAGKFFPSQTEQDIAAGSADVEVTRAFLKSKAANKKIADSLDNLTDEAVQSFGKLFQILPEAARITSGVRSRAEQARLYADYKAGRGGLAAKPGRSRHEIGAALDIGEGVDMATLREAVARTKELETLKGHSYEIDKVHVQLKGTQAKIEEDALDTAQKTAEQQADALVKLKEMIKTQEQDVALKQKIAALNGDLSLTENERAAAITRVTAEAAKEAEVEKLLAAAREAGLAITPALIAQYNALAQAKVDSVLADQQAIIAQKEFTASQQEAARAAKELQGAIQGALSGLIKDLIAGKDAGEAFADALSKVADKLLDIGLDSLFKMGGPGGAGGILGGTIIPGILHKGGVAGQDGYGSGRAVPASTFAGARRFHRGGLVGGEVPAILKRGEIVLPSASAMKRGSGNETVNIRLHDDSGRMAAIADQRIQTASGAIVKVSVVQAAKTVQRQLPGMMANAQTRNA